MLRLKILASAVSLAIAALFAHGELLAGPRPCIEVSGAPLQIATPSWLAYPHAGFTRDPGHATVRALVSGTAKAADFTFIDEIDAGTCAGSATPQPAAISRAADPVIYFSREGPADYFVSSKSFSLLDAAALIVGARGARQRIAEGSL